MIKDYGGESGRKETLEQEVGARRQAEAELRQMRDALALQVAQRTADLTDALALLMYCPISLVPCKARAGSQPSPGNGEAAACSRDACWG